MIKLKKISIFILPRVNRILAGEYYGHQKLPGFLAALRVPERLLRVCYKSAVCPLHPQVGIQPNQANPLFKYLNVDSNEHQELMRQFGKAARVEVVIDYPGVGPDFWVDLYFLESGEKRGYSSHRFRIYVGLFTGRVMM